MGFRRHIAGPRKGDDDALAAVRGIKDTSALLPLAGTMTTRGEGQLVINYIQLLPLAEP